MTILSSTYTKYIPVSSPFQGEVGGVLMRQKPENRTMQPTEHSPHEVTVIGKVVGVIRKI